LNFQLPLGNPLQGVESQQNGDNFAVGNLSHFLTASDLQWLSPAGLHGDKQEELQRHGLPLRFANVGLSLLN
jgi:hypothetical protein